MKKDQPNKTNVERVYRWQPLVWEPGLNGSGIDLQLVWEWAQCSCTSCTSMHQSWSRAEAEEVEWRQKGSEVARGEQRRGREVVPWQHPHPLATPDCTCLLASIACQLVSWLSMDGCHHLYCPSPALSLCISLFCLQAVSSLFHLMWVPSTTYPAHAHPHATTASAPLYSSAFLPPSPVASLHPLYTTYVY